MNSKKKDTFSLIVYVATIITLIPMFIPFFYIIPQNDDYPSIIAAQKWLLNGGGCISYVASRIRYYYLEIQGAWRTMVGYEIFNYYFGTSLFAYRLTSAMVFCIFLLVLMIFAYVVTDLVDIPIPIVVPILVIGTINHFSASQCVYWLGSSFHYLLSLTYALFSMLMSLLYSKKRNIICLGLCGGSAFLASGGVLMAAGFINAYLFFVFCNTKDKKRLIPFFLAFLGALLNVMAPGNRSRESIILNETGVNSNGIVTRVVIAIKDSCIIISDVFMEMLRNSYLIPIIIIGIIIGCFFYKRMKGKHIVCLGGETALIIFSAVYPVALGYSSPTIEVRGKYFLGVIVIIMMFLLSISIGGIISRDNCIDEITGMKRVLFVSLCFVVMVIINSHIMLKTHHETTSLQILAEYNAGFYDEYHDNILMLYNTVKAGEDDKWILDYKFGWESIMPIKYDSEGRLESFEIVINDYGYEFY